MPNRLRPFFDLGQRTALWPMLILRFALGATFLGTAGFWLSVDDRGASLVSQVTVRLDAGATVVHYRPFIENVVFPNAELFATLVTLGEVTIAVTMLLGLGTRFGAAVGMFVVANYALAWGNPFLPPAGNWETFWLFAIVLLTAPGRLLGVDAWLHRRWPRVPLW